MKRQRQNSGDQSSNSAGWLTTFNDLVTLLMVFFVLLFTMSSIDTNKMQEFQFALRSGLGLLEAGKMVDITVKAHRPVEDISDSNTQPEGAKKPKKERLTGLLSKAVGKALESDFGIQVTQTQQGTRLSFEDQILFDFGKAHINPDGHALLNRVAKVIQKRQDAVLVEGHTDSTGAESLNEHLSQQRADAVRQYFVANETLPYEKIIAVGYGSMRPIASNATQSGRAMNRRISSFSEEDSQLS